MILAGYTIANAEVTGVGQGFLTFALAIIGFIFKKILLAFTDPIWIESAMLIAGAEPSGLLCKTRILQALPAAPAPCGAALHASSCTPHSR